MFAVLGIIKVKPEFLAVFIEHVRLHAGKSLAEPGCLRYDVLQDRDDPHTICLYEIFRSEADLEGGLAGSIELQPTDADPHLSVPLPLTP
jgi:quinol monooxygenase YgiN